MASYLEYLGIVDLRVHTAEFEVLIQVKTGDKRGELASARMKRAHEAAAYDKWFRAQVQTSIDDPQPNVSAADARTEFAAKREALRARATGAK